MARNAASDTTSPQRSRSSNSMQSRIRRTIVEAEDVVGPQVAVAVTYAPVG